MTALRTAALVARREIVERGRTRSWRLTSLALVGLGIAGVFLVPKLRDATPRYDLAVVDARPGLERALEGAARSAHARVRVLRASGRAEALADVRSGRADAALAASTLVVRDTVPETLAAVTAQAVGTLRVERALAEAGVPPAERTRVLSAPPLRVDSLDPNADERDADRGLAFAATILLYLALLLTGTVLASGVGEEKATQVASVLLTVVRPWQLLAGKVAGLGVLGLSQVAAAVVPALVAGVAAGEVDLPDATVPAMALVLVWFVLGYLLYGCLYAALGALVSRQEEVGPATAPLTLLLAVGYFLSIAVADDPGSRLAAIVSFVPPLSPLVVPPRAVAGGMPSWQIAIAAALTAAASLVAIAFAARVYRRGIARTGPRLRLLEALRAEEPLRAGESRGLRRGTTLRS